jgi:hypothetical protein
MDCEADQRARQNRRATLQTRPGDDATTKWVRRLPGGVALLPSADCLIEDFESNTVAFDRSAVRQAADDEERDLW